MNSFKVQCILLFDIPAEDERAAAATVERWTDGMTHMVGAPIDIQVGVLDEDEMGYSHFRSIRTSLTEDEWNRLVGMFVQEQERVVDYGIEDDRRLHNQMVVRLGLPNSLCITHPKYLKSHPDWEK